jgi:hypothetical protein
MVVCFGLSVLDDLASLQGAPFGLESVLLGSPPPVATVTGEFDGRHLGLFCFGEELLRTDPLQPSLVAVLQRRAEVLLVWVDVPLRSPSTQLSQVGLEHVFTGIAPVTDGDLTTTGHHAPNLRRLPRRWVR